MSAYWAADRKYLWHPYTRHSAIEGDPFPLIVRGEGVYLYDAAGRRYFDAISSWWCCNLGHGHPRLVAAIAKQAAELQHSILGNLSHPRAVELAEEIARLFPGDRRVFFASDGASAVEAALKIAVQHWNNVGQPQRCRFAALEEGYHGDTLGAVSLGFMPRFHNAYKPLLFDVHRAEAPCCATCRYGKAPESCGVECFASMQRIIENHGDALAAVIVEPLCQGAAGMRIYSARYLSRLEAACRPRGILVIADEIAMGFGRTGRMFAFEHAHANPDIVCIGKGLSGGCLPISATVVREEIFRSFSDRPRDGTLYHGHTFAGNPIAAAAAVETLKIYREEGIVDRAARAGEFLAARMRALLTGQRAVKNIRTLGMIAAAELAPSAADKVRATLFTQGILIRPLGDVVYLMPPLVTPEGVLEDAVTRLAKAIADC